MSYSFSTVQKDKAAAIAKVAEELASIVNHQPVHKADQAVVQAAAEAVIGVLPDDPAQDIAVSVSGSLYHNGVAVAGCQTSISASFVTRPPAVNA